MFSKFVSIDKKKAVAGIVLAVLAALVFGLYYHSWKYTVLFAALFLGTGFLNVKLPKKAAWAAYGLWALACMGLAFVLTFNEIFPGNTVPVLWDIICTGMDWGKTALNFLCIAIVVGVVFLITGRFRLSVAIGTGALMVLTLINGAVYAFRGNEMIFADIMSVGTALNVVEQYHFTLRHQTVLLLFLWAAVVFAGFMLPGFPELPGLKRRLTGAAVTAAMLAALFLGSADIGIIMWDHDGTWFNGYYLNFYLSIRGYFVESPQGYSAEEIARLEGEYAASGPEENRDYPDIIVIMNESFTDLRVLGGDLDTDRPVMPFLDSLTENTVKGYALASVYGGTTANSEYEMLTGSSMAFMPDGSIPYQQYVKQGTSSLAWILQSYGYESKATHPYDADGWARPTAYPLLGFTESTFIEDYPNEDLIRYYISDREMYDYVLEKTENRGDSPLFLFGITMQNHGGYTYEGEAFEKTVSLEGYSGSYPAAEQYLSLVNQSDAALEYFLTELEKSSRDTVVLFFGDHLPKLENEFYEELHGGTYETLSEQMLQYTVPFAIWANFDIPEQTVPCTSLNYLGRYLLEAAGLELPPYYQFLKDAEEVIPAVNAMGYYSKSRQTCLTLEEAEGEEARWLNQYAILQHNGMFDRKNRSELFFGQYLK